MLKNDFYRIIDAQYSSGTAELSLQLNALHPIFDGHFPGQPVVPGVCLLQIVKDTLESALNYPVVLTKADYLKFIAPVVPAEDQLLQMQVKYASGEDNLIKASAVLKADTVACFKFQGIFRKAN